MTLLQSLIAYRTSVTEVVFQQCGLGLHWQHGWTESTLGLQSYEVFFLILQISCSINRAGAVPGFIYEHAL